MLESDLAERNAALKAFQEEIRRLREENSQRMLCVQSHYRIHSQADIIFVVKQSNNDYLDMSLPVNQALSTFSLWARPMATHPFMATSRIYTRDHLWSNSNTVPAQTSPKHMQSRLQIDVRTSLGRILNEKEPIIVNIVANIIPNPRM